ncbi:hypothetical protein V2K27_22685 [Pseudomonas alliivorans]|nr:hypothetical protein [Pseudomonas alliivorans]MEE4860986.1 hypothetical protein [Pseudomonas alliivorans]MEE4876133.1 hypothetical protein [Pseudomonas alliivorans]MEE4906834.1 hypothetical protein [Pseudomonas alliivorans]
MTITMSLEVEEGTSFDKVSLVLSKMGADYSVDGKYLTGNFNCSNCYFVFRYIAPHDAVAAEGVEVGWKVGVRGAFHSPIKSLSESWNEIKIFLTEFSIGTNLRFVLSFQYESVYAIRDEYGVKFLKSMVDDV